MLNQFIKSCQYTFKAYKYLYNASKCTKCGELFHIYNPRYTYKNLTVTDIKHKLCNHCIASEIEYIRNTDYLKFQSLFSNPFGKFDKSHKCDICHNKIESFKFISIEDNFDLRFCTYSWNSSYVCLDCIVETLRNAIICSDMLKHVNGRLYEINESGLILEKGKIKPFFFER